jgi:hypothetical protein
MICTKRERERESERERERIGGVTVAHPKVLYAQF